MSVEIEAVTHERVERDRALLLALAERFMELSAEELSASRQDVEPPAALQFDRTRFALAVRQRMIESARESAKVAAACFEAATRGGG